MPLAVFPKCFLDQLCVTQTMTVDQWLDMALHLDVDGYEFYWGFTPHADPAELERIRMRVQQENRSIPMMCYSPDFTKPNLTERKKEIEKQKVAIEATARLGGSFCRVLSGQRRPGININAGIQWVRECIHELLPHAEQFNVTLILENHYKDGYWTFPEFAQYSDVFLELVESIGTHPNFGINFDPSNAIVAGEDPLELLELVIEQVVTMHASDRYLEGGSLEDLRRIEREQLETGYASILKHGIIGQGLNDYERIFALLKAANFSGWISIEDGQDPNVGMHHLEESAAFLRQMMKSFDLT